MGLRKLDHRLVLAIPAAAVSAAVLLTSCDAHTSAGSCNVSVSSPDLIHQRKQAGIADCTAHTLATADGHPADLPDTRIDCLGSTAKAALSQVKGPAIINFWASTCGPCRKETPALAAFAKKYAGQVTVIGVDWLESYPGAAIDFAQQSGVTYPLLADPCGDLQQSDMRTPSGMPTTYFVRADGSLAAPKAGGFDSVAQIADAARQSGITLKAAG